MSEEDNRLKDYFNGVWSKLNGQEKALALNYARHLQKNMKISRELILKINDLHEKYPDFHMGHVPREKQ